MVLNPIYFYSISNSRQNNPIFYLIVSGIAEHIIYLQTLQLKETVTVSLQDHNETIAV